MVHSGFSFSEQLSFRMFGEGTDRGADEDFSEDIEILVDEGCGCPIDQPKVYQPTWGGVGSRVGWEQTLDQSTAITYSFEKEWEGVAPELYQLYGPAGQACEELWTRLDPASKRAFMTRFWQIQHTPGNGTFQKYFQREDANGKRERCFLQEEEGSHRLWLPLKRIDTGTARDSISGFVEADGVPWEIKASTFYYDLDAMKAVVRDTLPYLEVPPSEGFEGFPAERRIQVHVVAPLKRGGEHPPAENMALHKSFGLIQLFFSDFMFLRLGFTPGPKGEMCRGPNGPFKCDVFTDRWNWVIDEPHDGPVPREAKKFEIVGIRRSVTYGGAETAECVDDCSVPYRVGFEIRKSESFEGAVEIAKAIARAISSMKADGATHVGITEGRHINIDHVGRFADSSRMKQWVAHDPKVTPPFCSREVQYVGDKADVWEPTVTTLALYLFTVVGGKRLPPGDAELAHEVRRLTAKLWQMLALLLCSDWNKLVRTRASPVHVDTAFETVRSKGEGATDDDLEAFRLAAARYAYELSEAF